MLCQDAQFQLYLDRRRRAKHGMTEESLAKERALGLRQRQSFERAVKAGVPPPPRTVSILPQDARFLPYVPIGPQLRYYAELSGFSGKEAVKEAQRVRESQVSWLVEKSDYAPVFFNDPDTVVTSDGDPVKGADAPDIDGTLLEELKHRRQTYEGDVEFIELHPSRPDQTAPRNPRGRTGIAGRGTLYKWGPNHATDSIVTRYHPATGVLQFAAVWRKLDGKWAIPGHLVREGQEPGVPVKVREAFENGIPVIYFLGIAPGRYQAMLPAFISGWDAHALKARVAFGMPEQDALVPPENALERRYALRAVKHRLHQASFREAVITAYDGRCALSGLPEQRLLDAAPALIAAASACQSKRRQRPQRRRPRSRCSRPVAQHIGTKQRAARENVLLDEIGAAAIGFKTFILNHDRLQRKDAAGFHA